MNLRVLCVVVTYNPEISALKRSLDAIIEQGSQPLIVDNASSNVAAIRELCASNSLSDPAVGILELEVNRGLGVAHNQGIAHARVHGFSHVLLLDQDSTPLKGMVSSLVSASQRKEEQGLLSAVGATYLNADNGSESFFVRFGALKFKRFYCSEKDQDGCVKADFLISSGSLISLSSIDAIGEMDEELFIDHVDTEWFLRARSKGYAAYGVCDAVMQHGLGESTHQINLGGRQRNVPQHNPFRYYYIFRNSVLLYKRGYASLVWKWNDLQRLGMIIVMFGLLKAPRRANLKMIGKGIWHGIKGVTGPLDV